MGPINLLRAKSEEEAKNLYLKDHTIETLKRVEQLRKFVVINGMEINNTEKFFIALAVAGLLHDMGKVSYEFQKKVHYNDSEEWKSVEKFLFPINRVKIRHEILSAIWASVLLPNDYKWASWIRTALLLHHYNDYFYVKERDLTEIAYYDYQDEVRIYLQFLIDNWDSFRQFLENIFSEAEKIESEVVRKAIKKIDISGRRINRLLELIDNRGDLLDFAEFYDINHEKPDYEFLVFLGCLRRCDYSASGEVEIECSENFRDILGIMKEKIEQRFSKSLWQRDVLESYNGGSGVLIAPTGAGKTEFSILWASKIGRKFIYTLPLRVALNDIYHRFDDYLENKELLGLLHSTAFMEYVDEAKKFKDTSVEKKITSASLLSTPVILATPDQIFLTSLNYYGSDKVISVYPFSAIVLDEVQAYDPEMAAVIIKTLKIVEELGGKILVITATLPPYFRTFFFKDEETNTEIRPEFRLNLERSQIFDTEKVKYKIKNYTLRRHKIKAVDDSIVEYLQSSEDKQYTISVNKEIIKHYVDKLRKYGKKSIFIVVNNVSKAIKIFETLEDMKNKGELKETVFLLHSRLLETVKGDTIRKIKDILEEMKSNPEKEDGIIVVATQIIEASVDLDFDGMLTEISPVDSQIQRWGRVYRKRDNDYNGEPNIYVFIKLNGDRGTTSIYRGDIVKQILIETANVLRKFENRTLNYEDESKMLHEVFAYEIDGKKLSDMYIEEIVKNLEFLKYFSVEKKSQAQMIFRNIAGFQLAIPKIMEKYGKDWIKTLAGLLKNKEKVMSWNELEKLLGKSMWEIKKALYDYSTNIPMFYFNKIKNHVREFKGFYLFELNDEDAEIIYKYGLDKVLKERYNARDEEDELRTII